MPTTPKTQKNIPSKVSVPKETIKEETVKIVKTETIEKKVEDKKTTSTPVVTQTPQKSPEKDLITVTFYGKNVRKFFDKKWYFSIEDILAIAKSDDELKVPPRKENFEEVKKKVAKLVHNDFYSDADGCIALMKEVDGIFPGSLSRWLRESS